MDNRTFTLSEATGLLPELKQDLHRLQQLLEEYKQRHFELERTRTLFDLSNKGSGSEQDPYFEEESLLDFKRMEIDLAIENFTRKGVLLKSIDPGLIDFPAVIEGEPVLICWQEGEEHITHYHGWHDGFRNRKKLPYV